jgi:urease accessory protein
MKKYLGIFPLAMLSSAAMAHTGHPGHSGAIDGALMQGALHTLTGMDHLLTLLATGFMASLLGKDSGRFLLLFVGALAMGFLLAAWLPVAAVVEHGIVFGLMALGLLLMYRQRQGLLVSQSLQVSRSLRVPMLLVPAMGVCHGLAHGWEVPADASVAGFASGFLLMSVVLISSACAIARYARKDALYRIGGAFFAAAGAFMAW